LRNVGKLIAIVRDEGDARLPDYAVNTAVEMAREQRGAAGVATTPRPRGAACPGKRARSRYGRAGYRRHRACCA
jgi:hypothetical protein